MGYSKKRIDRNGKARFTACYLDARGALRSAGTFTSKKDADKAWQKAETGVGEGRFNDPRRGRQSFRRYITEEWLAHYVIEASTREAYTYQIGKHILPWFGPMRMNEIMPSHVREWVTDLQAKGVTPASIQKVRFILSAIFTTALNDVTFLHPCKGVKTPTVPRKPLKIITPEQFDAIYAVLPDAASRLLIETDIETGLRWGELTELRVQDLDLATRFLTVSRTVVQVDPKFHPTRERFLVKQYPKDCSSAQLGIAIGSNWATWELECDKPLVPDVSDERIWQTPLRRGAAATAIQAYRAGAVIASPPRTDPLCRVGHAAGYPSSAPPEHLGLAGRASPHMPQVGS
ncbi:MAG: hypothetical protein WAW53_07645 [Candidatus Dormiibacterota bacterium]